MSDEQLTDDALNRRAAELMRWTQIEFGATRWLGKPPFGLRCALPGPATDYGDALRLLEFVSVMNTTEQVLIVSRPGLTERPHTCRISLSFSDDWYRAYADTLPRAITRACVAALEAVREEEAK